MLEKTCENCACNKVCNHDLFGFENCGNFIPAADVVEVVRCKDCKFATELDKHCELSRAIYKHCSLLRGEPTNYVWHKYKRYYKNYSLVEADDYCSYGERKDGEGE